MQAQKYFITKTFFVRKNFLESKLIKKHLLENVCNNKEFEGTSFAEQSLLENNG